MTSVLTASVILPIIIQHPWQRIMTEACIRIMRANTKLPFELVVVETESQLFDPKREFADSADIYLRKHLIDVYIHEPVRSTMVKDLNRAIDACSGTHIVHTGNDVFPQLGWLEALWECFHIPDCGVATLAASDMKQQPVPAIFEGIYGPFMMFESKWRFDNDFNCIGSDTDLIMRVYRDGKRSYRNWRVQVLHFGQATYMGLYSSEKRATLMNEFNQLFDKKHGDSKLLIYAMLKAGQLI